MTDPKVRYEQKTYLRGAMWNHCDSKSVRDQIEKWGKSPIWEVEIKKDDKYGIKTITYMERDSKGRVITRVIDNYGDGCVDCVETSVYDKSGNKVKTSCDYISNVFLSDYVATYEYDKSGILKKYTNTFDYNGDEKPDRTQTWIHDDHGNYHLVEDKDLLGK